MNIMDILTDLLLYILIIIIGIILINWYVKKKGWVYRFRTSLYFILWWRTVMLLLVLLINLGLELFFTSFLHINLSYNIIPLFFLIIIFFINIYLGVKIFKFIYKQDAQESLVILLIIVIIELILETFLFYVFLIVENL
jgi:hypothetical protein